MNAKQKRERTMILRLALLMVERDRARYAVRKYAKSMTPRAMRKARLLMYRLVRRHLIRGTL